LSYQFDEPAEREVIRRKITEAVEWEREKQLRERIYQMDKAKNEMALIAGFAALYAVFVWFSEGFAMAGLACIGLIAIVSSNSFRGGLVVARRQLEEIGGREL
jgi:hypothetical protein